MEQELDYRKESRGLVRYARYYGKILGVAWQLDNTDYQQRSNKGQLAEKMLRQRSSQFRRRLISAALHDDLETNRELIGIGWQTIVLKEGQKVLKKSTDALGQPDQIMRYEITRILEHDQVLRDCLGSMHVPVTVSIDKLKLRPFPTMPSVMITQNHILHDFDVFHTPLKVINSDAFQNDLAQLITASTDLVDKNYHLDLIGTGNVVVESGTNRLKVVDTVMLPKYGLDTAANDGITQRELFSIKLDQLRSLRR